MMEAANVPTFSVVIPTFNRAAKLMRAIDSLNAQTYLNFEVIVCDDGSTDDTETRVQAASHNIRFRALRYLRQPNWGGPASPRNMGIRAAAAEWICFLDSDDSWLPAKLEAVMAVLQNSDLIYHDCKWIYPTHTGSHHATRTLVAPVFEDMMIRGHNAVIINSSVTVRKKLLEQVGGCTEDRELIGVEDADLWLKIARITDRFTRISQPLALYYADGGNITVFNDSMIKKLNGLFSRHAVFLASDCLRKKARSTHDYHIARIHRIMHQYPQAVALYAHSLRSSNRTIAVKSLYWIVALSVKRLPGHDRSLS